MMNEEFCQYLSDNEFSEFMQLWKKQGLTDTLVTC